MRLFVVLMLVSGSGWAQIKSYPFLPYMAEYSKVYEISENDELEIPIRGQKKKIKGYKTFAQYDFDINSKQVFTVPFLMSKFEDAVRPHLKGILLQEETRTIYKIEYGGSNLVVVFEVYGDALQYSITLLKTGALKQLEEEIDAEKMYNTLIKEGHFTLYINFASGNSELTEDALKIGEQIHKLMVSKPSLRLAIEGHTDNVGSYEKNKKLSLERANSVVKFLLSKGIESSRLVSKGFGSEKPIGENSSEEGRRKNRRVELVKLD
jgi:outer membrane protein OmpA-like peptidoglycan-associated protein